MERLFTESFLVNTDAAILRLKGFIDSTNASKLKDAIENVMRGKRFKIVLDFKKIEYVSSAGWGVLIGHIRDIRENNGDMVLSGMIQSVKSIYILMELDQLFKVSETLIEALRLIGKQESDIQKPNKSEQIIVQEVADIKQEAEQKQNSQVEKQEKKLITKVRSLEDAIESIIAEKPLISLKLLSQELRKIEHGAWRIGWFQLKRELKRLRLNSVKDRLYYAFLKAKEGK